MRTNSRVFSLFQSPGPRTITSGLLLMALLSFYSVAPVVAESDSREKARHLLNRIAYGPRPGDIDRVLKKGIGSYIEEQLQPNSIPEPAALRSLVEKSAALTNTPAQLFMNFGKQPLMQAAGLKGKKQDNSPEARQARANVQKQIRQNYMTMYGQITDAKLMRAVYSPRQLEEVMTEFWFNHFNVSFDKGLDHLWVGTYEEQAIRPYVLGNFRQLLGATAHHAAMLFYLDNWQNTSDKPVVNRGGRKRKRKGKFKGINENYARELMELHTLGVDGGYSQADVISLARILTGHGLQNRRVPQRAGGGLNNRSGYYFDQNRHDFSDKQFLGHTIKGSGKQEINQALDILAAHPSTARHISFKLAQYFVADKPPASLVNKLSSKFTSSGGNIRAVLQVLFSSPEFWKGDVRNAKYKTPYRYVVSSLRATDAIVKRSRPIVGFLQIQGMPLYKCLTPDGYKYTEEAWLSPSGLLQRIEFATALGAGRHPAARIRNTNLVQLKDIAGLEPTGSTARVIDQSHERLKNALVLGSPEFMKY